MQKIRHGERNYLSFISIKQHSSISSGELLPKGERRQVTLVVSEIEGYADLIEQLPPEGNGVLHRIRETVAMITEKYDGIVNQFADGEIVIVFGIPVTHEDDFARAARATLEFHASFQMMSVELKNRVGQSIGIRSGINTRLVIVHRIKEGDRNYRIIGDTLQTPTRLASLAKSDAILLSQQSKRLMETSFELKKSEPIYLNNSEEPVISYRIIAEKKSQSRIEATAKETLTKYTGRKKDLAVLKEGLEKVLRAEGQFITIEGEAGLGKSRLLYEFSQKINRGEIHLLQGRCQSYGSNIPYLPFIELLKSQS